MAAWARVGLGVSGNAASLAPNRLRKLTISCALLPPPFLRQRRRFASRRRSQTPSCRITGQRWHTQIRHHSTPRLPLVDPPAHRPQIKCYFSTSLLHQWAAKLESKSGSAAARLSARMDAHEATGAPPDDDFFNACADRLQHISSNVNACRCSSCRNPQSRNPEKSPA